MFSTKNVAATATKKSKYISPGNVNAMIKEVIIKTAASGSKQLTLIMETPPVTEAGFEPEEGCKGQIGKVAFPGVFIKMDNDKAKEEFNKALACIAEELDVRNELDKISAENFEDYIEKIKPLIVNKFAWWAVSGEEYPKQDGKFGVKLSLRRLSTYSKFVSKQESELGTWDKSKGWNYKALPKTDQSAVEVVKSDLPF